MANPIKKTFRTEWFPILLLILAVGFSLWSYNLLPENVVTHWNFAGQADGWNSKIFHALFFPGLLIAMYFLFNILPAADPKKERYQEFANVYLLIRNSFLFFLTIIFGASTFTNLGYNINIGAITGASVGLLFVLIGNYFGKLKLNYFVGFRTPWTLSSENVWNKTHRVGGKVFMLWGLLLIITPWLNPQSSLVIMGTGIAAMIGVMIYSYLLFKKEKEEEKK